MQRISSGLQIVFLARFPYGQVAQDFIVGVIHG